MDARAAEQPAIGQNNSTSDRAIIRIPAVIRFGFQTISRISPKLAAEAARQIFFRPPRVAYRGEQHAVLANAQQGFLDLRKGRVRVYCWGDGPAVLLLHGWGGHSGQMTEFVAPLTKAGYRIVAIDAPAHGQSSGRLSSIIHFADAIAAAASSAGPLHAIIAHSLGTTAAVHALTNGLTVRRAVFLAPQARLTGYWQAFRQSLGMSEPVWQRMTAISENWLKVRFADLHPADIAPRMKTPVLILHGTSDRMTPVAQGKELAALWPDAEFQAVEAGHLSILRDWRVVLSSLEFIKG